MQSAYLSFLVSGSADQLVRERVQQAEREALVRQARSGRSVVAQVRLAVGQVMVGSGRWVAGRPRRKARALEVPAVYKLAR
jgi:hypothetical protein